MLPAWLMWLLPVPLATVGAIVWASWTSRARGPEQAIDTVSAFERFRSAMGQPAPGQAPGRHVVPAQPQRVPAHSGVTSLYAPGSSAAAPAPRREAPAREHARR